MLHPNTITSLGTFAMLAVCVLAIGFMLCFFLALANDDHKIRMARRVVVNHAVDALHRHRGAVVEPGTHIALGVLRITSVLAANPCRGEERADAHLRFAGRHRKPSSVNEGVYRLG
jgi:hypothetical protein